jgi:hypothetical protein
MALKLKGSVQRKLTWVENSANCWVLASDCGAGHYFGFLIYCHLVLYLFPFPLSTEKLLGEFYYNRRIAANTFPRFAYSCVSFILRQYYWHCDLYSACGQSAAKKKNLRNFLYWRYKFAALRL